MAVKKAAVKPGMPGRKSRIDTAAVMEAAKEAMQKYHYHRKEAERHEEEKRTAFAEYMATMDYVRQVAPDFEGSIKSTGFDDDGVQYKGTLVEPRGSVKIDEAALIRRLTGRQWDSVTVRVLDFKKLEDAVNAGQIPLATVEACSHMEDRAPYLRITEVKAKPTPVVDKPKKKIRKAR